MIEMSRKNKEAVLMGEKNRCMDGEHGRREGMTVLMIANPAAGGGSGRRRLPAVEGALERRGVAVKTLVTGYHGHAEVLARDHGFEGYEAVVSLGGDGTNYQVLNGLLSCRPEGPLPPLGVIPTGSGNSFALDLGVDSEAAGVSALVRGVTRAVDVLCFTQGQSNRYCVNLIGAGFVTDVARTASRLKWMGALSYVMGVVYRSIRLEFFRAELEMDGVRSEEDHCFIEFCNSRYTGGRMLMAPGAEIDDGYMDVIRVSRLSRWSLLSTLPKLFSGTHGRNPAVSMTRARRAVLTTVPSKHLLPDGELFGSCPVEVTVLPGKVRYLCAAP
jgi:YegS/Rv2252/BmrU family lipid kinase